MTSKASKNLLIYGGYLGEPSGTRTRDPLIKSQMLYRPELTAHTEEIQRVRGTRSSVSEALNTHFDGHCSQKPNFEISLRYRPGLGKLD
jgi:hypothetical protein